MGVEGGVWASRLRVVGVGVFLGTAGDGALAPIPGDAPRAEERVEGNGDALER